MRTLSIRRMQARTLLGSDLLSPGTCREDNASSEEGSDGAGGRTVDVGRHCCTA